MPFPGVSIHPQWAQPKRTRRFRHTCAVSWLIASAFYQTVKAQHECCGASGSIIGSDPSSQNMAMSVGTEVLGDAASCEMDADSSVLSVRTMGYFGYGISNDGHRGDPLGTGGKPSLLLLTSLYKENSNELPSLSRRDLRTQYGDFGYIPLWKNNVLLARIHAALGEQFTGVASVAYGGELGQPGTAQAAGAFGIGEVSLSWKPSAVKGFVVTGGNILDHGYFCPLFNQNPVENFIYTGLRIGYTTDAGRRLAGSVAISGGGMMNNLVALQDQSVTSINPSSFYMATRNRSFAGAKIGLGIARWASFKVSAGYQFVPADTMESVSDIWGTTGREYRRSTGWYGGAESALLVASLTQNISFVYARGDVVTGAGSPDYVRYIEALSSTDSAVYVPGSATEWLSRQRSDLKVLAYWLSWPLRDRIIVSAAAWIARRDPDPNPVTERNMNVYRFVPDSVLSANGLTTDSVLVVRAEPSIAVKGAVAAAVKIAGPLSVSLGADRIDFRTPGARLNGQEPLRDQTMRPVENAGSELYTQARYEREPVDAWILTPQVVVSLAGIGGFSAAFSQAWYEQPVDRQGAIADRHNNFTISAFINHRFSVKRRQDRKVLSDK